MFSFSQFVLAFSHTSDVLSSWRQRCGKHFQRSSSPRWDLLNLRHCWHSKENKGDCTSTLHNLLQHLTVPEMIEKFVLKGCIRSVQLQIYYLKFLLWWTRRTNFFLFLFNILSYLKIIVSPLSLLVVLSNSASFSVSWQAVTCSEPCCSPLNLLQIHLKCLRSDTLIQLFLGNAEQGRRLIHALQSALLFVNSSMKSHRITQNSRGWKGPLWVI